MEKLKNNVTFGRNALSLTGNEKYMMSFAWVNPKELVLLEAFPEVIMIDTTEKQTMRRDHYLLLGEKIPMETCLFF